MTENKTCNPWRETRSVQVLSHPTIIAATEFITRLGIRISKTTIREELASCPEFPKLGLFELQTAFDHWKIPSAIFTIEPEAIRSLPVPIIVSIDDSESDETTDLSVLAIVTAWQDQEICLSHPTMGEIRLSWGEFLHRWNRLMFAAGYDEAANEADFEEKHEAEKLGAAVYREEVRIIDRFLTQSECTSMINYCESENLFRRSPVAYPTEETRSCFSKVRTSLSAFIPRDAMEFRAIRDRAANLFGISEEKIEALQCARYEPGQQFRPHIDGLGRTHTLLIYLNDEFLAGETVFPEIDLAIRPLCGSAVLFRNTDDRGEAIPWSRHAGAPPQSGWKYVCNVWAHGSACFVNNDCRA